MSKPGKTSDERSDPRFPTRLDSSCQPLLSKSPYSVAARSAAPLLFQLARADSDVTVIAHPGSVRLQQFRRGSGIVSVKGERAGLQVTDTLAEKTPYDLLIVTVVAYQADAVLPALQRSKAKFDQLNGARISRSARAAAAQDIGKITRTSSETESLTECHSSQR